VASEPEFGSVTAKLAARDLRKIAALLILAAVPQKSPHRVHLGVACGGVRARAVDFLEYDAGFGDAHPCAAVFFRNQRSQVSGSRKNLYKFLRIFLFFVYLAPVDIREIPA
jgi:hypothetical protein